MNYNLKKVLLVLLVFQWTAACNAQFGKVGMDYLKSLFSEPYTQTGKDIARLDKRTRKLTKGILKPDERGRMKVYHILEMFDDISR